MRQHWLPKMFQRVHRVEWEWRPSGTTNWFGDHLFGFATPRHHDSHAYRVTRLEMINPVNLVWFNVFRRPLERAIATPRTLAARMRRCLQMVSARLARRSKRRGFIQSLRVA